MKIRLPFDHLQWPLRLILLSFLCGFPSRAIAQAILEVCESCDYTTIQDAVDAAPPDAEIRVAVGSYSVTRISKSVRLMGGWSPEVTIRNVPRYVSRVEGGFVVESTSSRLGILIDGFTIAGGTRNQIRSEHRGYHGINAEAVNANIFVSNNKFEPRVESWLGDSAALIGTNGRVFFGGNEMGHRGGINIISSGGTVDWVRSHEGLAITHNVFRETESDSSHRSAIWVNEAKDGDLIAHNVIHKFKYGVRMQGREPTDTVQIHHNHIIGSTSAIVTGLVSTDTRFNLIQNAERYGIVHTGATSAGRDAEHFLVQHNVVTGTGRGLPPNVNPVCAIALGGLREQRDTPVPTALISENIFTDGVHGVCIANLPQHLPFNPFTVRRNVLYGNQTPVYFTGEYDQFTRLITERILTEVAMESLENFTENVVEDPMFIDEPNGDVHLNELSFLIDEGTPERDVGAEPAPHGDLINIGYWGGTSQAKVTPPLGELEAFRATTDKCDIHFDFRVGTPSVSRVWVWLEAWDDLENEWIRANQVNIRGGSYVAGYKAGRVSPGVSELIAVGRGDAFHLAVRQSRQLRLGIEHGGRVRYQQNTLAQAPQLDCEAPVLALIPPAQTTINPFLPEFRVDAHDNSGEVIVLFSYKPLGGSDEPISLGSDSTPPYAATWGSIQLDEGQTYLLEARGIDASGNEEIVSERVLAIVPEEEDPN